MAAPRYRAFMKLCENWPVLKGRDQRDIGLVIKKRVVEAFSKGEASAVNVEECDKIHDSLQRILNNTHKRKWARSLKSNATGSSLESLDEVLSADSLSHLSNENVKGWKDKLNDFLKKNKE